MFVTMPAFWFFPLGIVSFLWIVNRILVPKPLPGIPYNRWTRWLPCGDLFTLGIHVMRTGSTFDWLPKQCLNLRSPIVQVMIPSFSMKTPVVLVSDLFQVKDIIVKRANDIDRATLIHFWFSLIVPNATTGMQSSPSFQRQRRLWNGMLTPDFLDNVATPAFEATIRRSVQLWVLKSKISEGSSFKAYDDLRRITLEGIWKVLLGRDLGLAEASISYLQEKNDINTASAASEAFPHFFQDFIWLLTGLLWVVTGITPRIYKWTFTSFPRFRTALNRTKNLFEGIVSDYRLSAITGAPTIRCGLSEALRQRENTGSGVSDAAIIDELLELLVTGHETTATTTAWGLKYLADHQEIQQRLHVALKQAFPGATPSNLPSGLDISHADIPYLDAALAEILRVACTGPVLFKETLRDCEILGRHVPAKTPVLLITQSPPENMITHDTFELEKGLSGKQSPQAQSWNSSFEQFIPERWLDGDGKFDADAGLDLPFSAGKRGCFGKRIAVLELRLLIATFVLSFRFAQLPKSKSKYISYDSLTRQPSCCYVQPTLRDE